MKILSNQDKVKAKEITVDNIKIGVLAKGHSARLLGQNHVRGARNRRNQKQAESSVRSFPQISPTAYLESLPSVPQAASFQHDYHANIDLRRWYVDTRTKT